MGPYLPQRLWFVAGVTVIENVNEPALLMLHGSQYGHTLHPLATVSAMTNFAPQVGYAIRHHMLARSYDEFEFEFEASTPPPWHDA